MVTIVPDLVLGNDNVVFLDALAAVLAGHGYRICGVTTSSADMVATVGQARPDVCLIDRQVARDDDTSIIARVRAHSSRTAVLVLGADPRSESAVRAIDAGAAGYLHQSRGIRALIAGLERVLSGDVVIDVPGPGSVRRSSEVSAAARLLEQLTTREWECLMMLVEGLDTTAMVQRLGVARTTVRTHLQSVLTKLGVHSRLEAASLAVRHGLPEMWSQDAYTSGTQDVGTFPRQVPGLRDRRPARLNAVSG